MRRDLTATAPNQLRVTDLTYVPTWAGRLRRACAPRWSGAALVAHSDAGSQFTSIRYGERLAELGARPSIGTVGDSYDNALAETVNGLDKTELTRGPGQGPGAPSPTSSWPPPRPRTRKMAGVINQHREREPGRRLGAAFLRRADTSSWHR